MSDILVGDGEVPAKIRHLSNNELLSSMQNLVRTERKITHMILLHIVEIEDRKLYADLGYDGMFPYLTRGLGYSEGSAYRRLHSARLLAQIPEVATKIESGSLNLSQLTKMQKCLVASEEKGEILTTSKALDVLEKIEHKNIFETQKTLAQEMNMPIESYESITPQRDESVRILVTLTKEQFSQLELAKSLLSHICIDGSWAQVIGKLAEVFNKKKLEARSVVTRSAIVAAADRVGRWRREEGSQDTSELMETDVLEVSNEFKGSKGVRSFKSRSERGYLPVGLRRELFKKAQFSCEYIESKTGKKCQSSYQLQIDHRIPIALGGSDRIENLRVLCRTHNLAAARKMGIGRQ